MAQETQTVSLFAPAFNGVNTESSPVQLDPSFAVRANNCIIDREGRLGARKGLQTYIYGTVGASAGVLPRMLHTHVATTTGAVTRFMSLDDGSIVRYTTSGSTDYTPAGYTIVRDYWQAVQLGTKSYFFCAQQEPLVFTEGDTTLETFTTAGGIGFQEASVAHSAFGRVWKANVSFTDSSTLWYSDLLNGLDYHHGSSGSIDLSTVWPNGKDSITAIASHNNFLIIFGRQTTLVYQGAEDPATMSLADIIPNIGCIARDSIQVIGTDLLFLSDQGVRSLGRTIQEKSVAIGTISANIKSDLLDSIQIQNDDHDLEGIKAIYSGRNNFYLLSFPEQKLVYCFDVRTRLENGAMPVTTWGPVEHYAYTGSSGLSIASPDVGGKPSVFNYAGYRDPGFFTARGYIMEYEAPTMVFGDAQRLKFLKKVGLVVSGEVGTNITLKWGYGYGESYKSKTTVVSIDSDTGAQFGVGEYSIEEFNPADGPQSVKFTVNANGSGEAVRLGLSAEVKDGYSGGGSNLGIYSINLQTLLGKYI